MGALVALVPRLICTQCGEERLISEYAYKCSRCDYPLEVRYDQDEIYEAFDIDDLSGRAFDMWKYRELLPVRGSDSIVSIQEGGTPLVKAGRLGLELGLEELYIKDETRNPTWSFKDRGSSVGLSMAVEVGAGAVGCVSSGNMAASMAAYAARAGVRCVIVVPRKTPMGKIVQMLVCGASLSSVEAPYHLITRRFIENSVSVGVYSVHNDAPMRVEGQKTVSFEIAEQLGWEAPDWVIIPTSSAGNFSAAWKGFSELEALELTVSRPRMGLAQAAGNAPIVMSFRKGLDHVEPNPNPKTVASAISNPDPPSGKRALSILKESRGYGQMVSDEEILEAQRLLASAEGLFVEPAAAVPLACLRRLLADDVVACDERVVLVVTGSGLKDIDAAMTCIGRPVELSSLDEMAGFMGMKD
jgi:threonine synthase